MRKLTVIALCAFFLNISGNVMSATGKKVKITKTELLDKIKGSWIGQMAGCSWGGPTEFHFNNTMIPEGSFPAWIPEKINEVFTNLGDDVYCELPYLDAMNQHGVNCSWSVFGEVFRDSKFDLWHANYNGRENLRAGLKVPESGFYKNNFSKWTKQPQREQDDIDFQIESDFAGVIAPGLPNAAIEIAWRAGHVMNWGNGVYGGVFVAAMHAKAYTAKSVSEIVETGRLAIPKGTRFRNMIEEVIAAKKAGKSFEENWKLVTDKYKRTTIYGIGDPKDDLKASDCDYIDVTQNGGYVLLGLLYGNGDFEQTMKLAMKGGCDSDCNPSTVASILGGFIGYKAIPEKWKSGIDLTKKLPYTEYNFDDCVKMSYKLAKEVVLLSGGKIEGEGSANETWIIQPKPVQAVAFEQCEFGKNELGIVDSRLPIDNEAPNLQAKVTNQKGRKLSFSANATDTDGIKEYCWFFGDLSFEKGQNPAHTYLNDGDYNVICYATDKRGYTSLKELNVSIKGEIKK